jgi:hypothetical protein
VTHLAAAQAHAAVYYDRRLIPDGFTPRDPAALAQRADFIHAAEPRPGVTPPPIATACDSCRHDTIEDLRWLGRDGGTALCIDMAACKQRRTTDSRPEETP